MKEKIVEFLKTKWTKPTCACTNINCKVSDKPYYLSAVKGSTIIPVFLVTCTNCAHVAFISPIAMGISPEELELEIK